MLNWDAFSIGLLARASEELRFTDRLAEKAARYLPAGGSVCDAGCGLGYLSTSLLSYCREVTAMDLHPVPLQALRERKERDGLQNLHILQADAFNLPAETQFDGMTSCFFGSMEESLDVIARHCRQTAVFFKKGWPLHRFSLKDRPLGRYNLANSLATLEEAGIPYRQYSIPLDMGQPFLNVDEARAFFKRYDQSERAGEMTEAEVLARLEYRPGERYHYYLPALYDVGMLVINVGDLPAKYFSTGG